MNAIRPSIASVLIALCCASTAVGQTLEAGATIAPSCLGGGTTLCDETQSNLLAMGPFASIWFKDFIEVGGRVVWLDRNDFRRAFGLGLRSSCLISERERTIAHGEIVWHFRREKRLRVMFGLGLGWIWDSEVISCQPAGCEPGIGRGGSLLPGDATQFFFFATPRRCE